MKLASDETIWGSMLFLSSDGANWKDKGGKQRSASASEG
jgi:hypothetical protein